ncbi:MAG: hypothetical protein GXP31_02125 [Kiritimatiellaeota bacterium]|nr:hypothetical protein [Kiritimatiellota bacterium]
MRRVDRALPGIVLLGAALAGILLGRPARGLDRPWIADVFFYWYEWDPKTEQGNWINGVHNTPLQGYYDSRTFRDNYSTLKTAAEWGITHHFIDYWGFPWKDEKGRRREKVVFEAAEALKKQGYDIAMGFYQDGKNFAMDVFAKNLTEHRDTEYWLREFAHSPLWPRLNGRPVQLVYGRNGRPVPTQDNDAYRRWLRKRYKTPDALNREWGTDIKGFDAVRLQYGARGPERADAVEFAFVAWRREWAKLDAVVQQRFGFPGIKASFDVGYTPFRNFGYLGLTRTFCGPHSYGGIFGPPAERDVERFIQAQVAKHYDSVFFDHFKNYYHDWDIRVPGFAYLPDPVNFDRFWTGALMRRSEALLHLSWNEWWEGSNLEPSREFGKKYCEKNLFYATLMKRCFPDIRSAWQRAPIAVLLNDYALRCGAADPDDLYRTITTLRRLNAPFDLFPDARATPAALERFKVIVAPACGQGFGRNDRREELLPMLLDWASKGGLLILSADAKSAEALGLRRSVPPPAAGPTRPGPDLNVFVDVGTDGDERFLASGYSGRENWGKLPAGTFGAGTEKTVRWVPGSERTTHFRFPSSPLRDHVLRLGGSAIWDNRVTVTVNGRRVGQFPIAPGENETAIAIPAEAIGGRPVAEVKLNYAAMHVPGRKDPKRFGGESRICNLALEWVQFSTADIPARNLEQRYRLPKAAVVFLDPVYGALKGQTAAAPYTAAPWLKWDGVGARVLSKYADGRPRGILVPRNRGRVLYVNGSFGDFSAAAETPRTDVAATDLQLWDALLAKLGKTPPDRYVSGAGLGGERLRTGTTDILPVYNYRGDAESAPPVPVRLSVPAGTWPLSEAVALSRDGERGPVPRQLSSGRRGDRWEATDTVRWCAVYAFVHAPAALDIPTMSGVPGETVTFPVTVRNLTDRPLSGTLRVTAGIPTVSGEARPFTCPAGKGKEVRVGLPVRIADSAEWGRKTVTVELDWGADEKACFFRPLIVQKLPELEFTPVLIGNLPGLQVRYPPAPSGLAPSIGGIRIVREHSQTAHSGTLAPGQTRTFALDGPAPGGTLRLRPGKLRFSYLAGTRRVWKKLDLLWPVLPEKLAAPNAQARALLLWNPTAMGIGPIALTARLPRDPGPWHIADDAGRPVPDQSVPEHRRVLFAGVAPAESARLYWLVPGKAPETPRTDLTWRVEGELGSGTGRVIVENAWFRVDLDEAAGGTVTRLVSKRTGRNYARNHSFDFNFGRFTKPGHPRPKVSTAQLIDEKKTRLSDGPHPLKLTRHGPLWVVVESLAILGATTCSTRYEFVAYQPMFRIIRRVRRSGGPAPEEVVVLDSDLEPNLLRKSSPGFAGISAPAPKCHYGWRYSDWVPPDITLLPARPGTDTEAITFHIVESQGIDRVRQGFWPANRPKVGPRATARIEYISRKTNSALLNVRVRLHTGWQLQGRRWFDTANRLRLKTINLPKDVRQAASSPVDWWCTAWPRRQCVSVQKDQVHDGSVSLRIGGRESPAPESVRLIEHRDGALLELPYGLVADGRTVVWRAPPEGPWPRRYHVYWAPADFPAPLPTSDWTRTAIVSFPFEESFAESGGWRFSGVVRREQAGRNGTPALFFDTPKGGPRIAICDKVLPEVDTAYRVRFTAKAEGDTPSLATNLYAGPGFDGPQTHTALKSDGAWHEYGIRLPPARFPPEHVPRFRFWVMPGDFRVWLDRVRIERAGPAAAPRRSASLEAPVESLPLPGESQ